MCFRQYAFCVVKRIPSLSVAIAITSRHVDKVAIPYHLRNIRATLHASTRSKKLVDSETAERKSWSILRHFRAKPNEKTDTYERRKRSARFSLRKNSAGLKGTMGCRSHARGLAGCTTIHQGGEVYT